MTAAAAGRRDPPASGGSDDHRAGPASEGLPAQVERVGHDLAAHRWLAGRGDSLARGAALAAAHGALALATAPLFSQSERDLRRAALDAVMPALAGAGLDHVADLIAVALALELHPVCLERPDGAPQ